MGNNVMLYVDDIQHTSGIPAEVHLAVRRHPRIEGVWRGQTRTYDLRGASSRW
jgi:hypothetical protein